MSKPNCRTEASLRIIVTAPHHRCYEARLDGHDYVLCISRTPFFDAARKLIAQGYDPGITLILRHAGSDTDSLRARLGTAAALTVEETGYGPQLRRWKPMIPFVLRNEQWLTNGIYGITGTPRPTIFGWRTNGARDFYFLCLGTLALFSLAAWWMLRSPWGRAFVALRENPIRALSLGLDTRRYTLMAFAIGSSLGELSGALYAPLVQFIEPNSFALGLSFNLLLMVIVGGSGNFFGPFVGALVAVLLPEWLRITQGYYLILYAAAIMVMMAFCPSGLLGLLERATRAFNGRRAEAATSVRAEGAGT